jgi:hypothetical protein
MRCTWQDIRYSTLSVPMYIAREELDTDFVWTRGIVDESWSRRQSLRVL